MSARVPLPGVRLLALVLVALLAPTASAEPGCATERIAVEPDPVLFFHAGVVVEERSCAEHRSFHASLREPNGRLSLEWYEDERGLGLDVFYPPYLVSWTDTERGCVLVVYLFAVGAVERECPAGPPPSPSQVPL